MGTPLSPKPGGMSKSGDPGVKVSANSCNRTFESGFLALILFPFLPSFFPKVIKARELIAAAMLEYMRKGGYKTASGLIRKRYEHHRGMFGMTLEDVARGELGNSSAC